MVITKQHFKILKYVYRHKTVSYQKLRQHFKKIDLLSPLDQFIRSRYIIQIGGYLNKYGEPIPITDSTYFKLDDLGIAEVESKQWFNFQFVLLQIILPIVIAIITTLITIFLSA